MINSKFLFKGWILILDDNNDCQQWIPKYAVVGNTEKQLVLINYESKSQVESEDSDDELSQQSKPIVYRIDNFTSKDSFLNYWKSKSILIDRKILQETNKNNNNNNNELIVDNQESPSFSLSGLFKKSTSSAAKQHASLKRAKSGIQIDRKKLTFNLNSSKNVTSASTTPFKSNNKNNLDENRISLPPSMRPSRSHESLSHLHRSLHDDITRVKIDFSSERKIKLNINSNQNYIIQIISVHSSLLQLENCFELRYLNSNDNSVLKRFYFMCRTTEERDKWIYILKNISNSNQDFERRSENSLEVWLLEAKGNSLSQSSKKRYYSEIVVDNLSYGRTISKEKKDILFWGESFDFSLRNNANNHLRVDLYQESIDTKKKKIQNRTNNQLIGSVYIPVSSLQNNHQFIEKWYRLDNPNDPILSALNGTLNQTSTISSSNTTTQNLGNTKDSITMRIKLKYNCIDILPLNYYSNLIHYLRNDYLNLMQTLEPLLGIRAKDDLSNTLVRITFKLQYSTQFLVDLVMSEISQLDDTSLIFRGNSLATKSIEAYMKLVGESYLKQTLSDIIKSIIETNHDLEIDPSKINNQNNLQSNREELIQILHLVCGRVFNSCMHFPRELKIVFCRLRDECKIIGKSDETCDMLISASIFLRFICPAILSPNLFNLIQEYPQEKAARKLTLAAKTLQTIANFSKFGGKESYMSFDKMNKFVDEHTLLMKEFLRNISTSNDLNDSIEAASPINIQNEIPFNHDIIDIGKQLSILHTILTNNLSNIDQSKLENIKNLQDLLTEITNFKLMVTTKPLIYDNFYHHEVMQQEIITSPKSPTSIAAVAHDAVNGVTNLIEKELNLSSSPAQSPNLKQQYLKMFASKASISLSNLSRKKKLIGNSDELNEALRKLQETEDELKREQDEKNLIEIKYNQEKEEHEKKLQIIINRLAQVEDELGKEKAEMDRLLKTKQAFIDQQKKQIESLVSHLATQQKQQQQQNQHNRIKASYTTQDIVNSRNYASSLLSSSASSSSTSSSSQSMTHSNDLGSIVPSSTTHYLRTSEL